MTGFILSTSVWRRPRRCGSIDSPGGCPARRGNIASPSRLAFPLPSTLTRARRAIRRRYRLVAMDPSLVGQVGVYAKHDAWVHLQYVVIIGVLGVIGMQVNRVPFPVGQRWQLSARDREGRLPYFADDVSEAATEEEEREEARASEPVATLPPRIWRDEDEWRVPAAPVRRPSSPTTSLEGGPADPPAEMRDLDTDTETPWIISSPTHPNEDADDKARLWSRHPTDRELPPPSR